MIILDTTTKSLEAKLSGSASVPLSCVISWSDIGATATTPGGFDTGSNGTTAVTIAASPASGIQRIVKTIIIHN